VRSSDRPTLRVLYAEDAFDQALLVRSFLQSAGNYEVVHVQDGDQAVRRIGDEDWDLLVSDLNLPGTDGFDVIRAFRDRFADRGDPHAAMDDDEGASLEPLLDRHRRQREGGLEDAPYPPHYPKQPGEPTRVAPSRAKKP